VVDPESAVVVVSQYGNRLHSSLLPMFGMLDVFDTPFSKNKFFEVRFLDSEYIEQKYIRSHWKYLYSIFLIFTHNTPLELLTCQT